jgi:hypothetical protein
VTDIEQALYGTLCELEATVSGLRAGQSRPELAGVLAKLGELTRSLPATTDPRLRHYLERQSYEKARHHLERAGRPEESAS